MPPPESSSWKPTVTRTFVARSSVASPNDQKPKTPLIAGSVCGGLMGIAWIVGFTIYFIKRYKRKKFNRQVKAGKVRAEKKPVKAPEEKIIIPPDPAILLGHIPPGETTVRDNYNVAAEHCSRQEK